MDEPEDRNITVGYKYVSTLNAAYKDGNLKRVSRILSCLAKETKEVLRWFAFKYYWDGAVARSEIAFKCHKLAADLGEPDSQRLTGMSYYEGDGVDENLNHALHYSKMAADQGVDSAKTLVAKISYQMDDEENALKYAKMKAESDSDSQRILGDIYLRKGDYENAYKYYKLLGW